MRRLWHNEHTMADENKTAFKALIDNVTVGDVPELSETDVLMRWTAKEFEESSLDQQQVATGSFVALILLIWSIATANFLFTIIIVLVAVVMYLFLNRSARTLDIALTPKGLIYGEKFLAYSNDLTRFWILYDPPALKQLNFAQTGLFRPTLAIDLGDTDPIEVREILLDYLDEDLEAEEHTADRFSRRIGF